MRTEIVTGMPDPEYRAHAGVSISELKTLASGVPAACKAYRERKTEPTPSMIFGKLVHLAVLECHLFADGFSHHVRPDGLDGRTKDCKAWLQAHSDLPILDATGDMSEQTIRDMQASINAMPWAKQLLRNKGSNEASVFAMCPETGLQLKGRLDRLSEDDAGNPCIVDLKTTDDPARFEQQAASLRYWQQDAYYTRLLELNGIANAMFVFVVVGTQAPHAVRVGCLPIQAREAGRRENERLLKLYAKCRLEDKWPSYRVQDDGLPCGLETFQLKIWNQ